MRIGPRPRTALRRSYRQPDTSRGRKNSAGVEATLHSRRLSRGCHAAVSRRFGRSTHVIPLSSDISLTLGRKDGLCDGCAIHGTELAVSLVLQPIGAKNLRY